MDRRYQLARAGHPFLLAIGAIIALPASWAVAAALSVLSGVAFMAQPTIHMSAAKAGLVTAAVVGLYTTRAQGNVGVGVVSALLIGLVAFTACSGLPDRWRVEVRAFAFAEIFVYASAGGLALGMTAANENRRFLVSTVGVDRFSFAFASSPSQGAMVAGVAVVLATMTTLRMPLARRVALGCVSLVLVWGANYRFIVAVVVGVGALSWWRARRRRRRRLPARERLDLRVLARAVILVAVLPLWWPTASRLAAEPLATIFASAPAGFGSRSTTLSDIEETRTLNGRTTIWDETIRLLRRSTDTQLLVGHGYVGGDDVYRLALARAAGPSFDRLDTISAHNTWLEQLRRGGLVVGGTSIAIMLSLFRRARRRISPACFAAGATLVAAGGADIAVMPSAIVTTAMFITLCLPLRNAPVESAAPRLVAVSPLPRPAPSSSRRMRSGAPYSPLPSSRRLRRWPS